MDLRLDPVDSLVERHLPLVYSAARRYAGSGEPLEDLVQAGSVGLVAAARRLDPPRGVPVSAVAADEFAACEDRELVRELFAVLAPRERALVRLRFGEDLSQAEIGRLMDISQSQASRLLSAALEKLRALAVEGGSRAA